MLNISKGLLMIVIAGTLQGHVVLSGTVKDCFMGGPIVAAGVKVGAFQVRRVRPLVRLLQTMDTLTIASSDTGSFARFAAKYDQVISLDTTTAALARATSGKNGLFRLSIAPVDSVLLVGYAEREDQVFYYSYSIVPGMASAPVVIDMSGGRCGS
jgi:hypothetical protein